MVLFLRIFLVYITLVLVWFMPSHIRGQVTMGPREASAHSCCDVSNPPAAEPASGKPLTGPTQKDKANCAICFWAAGILPVAPVIFDFRPVDLSLIEAENALAQFAFILIPSESLPRGPPTSLA